MDFTGSSPLTNVFVDAYITNNIYNEFLENRSFSIEFRNVQFDCNGVNDDKTYFTDCDKGGWQNSYIFFGQSNSYSELASYSNMCGTQFVDVGLSDADNYTNRSFPETLYLDANPTDVTTSNPNVTLDYYFSYNGLEPNPNPFTFYRYYGTYTPYFQCPDLSYNAVIKIPTSFISLTAADITYFPDPNLTATSPTSLIGLAPEPGYNVYRITGIDHDGKLSLNCQLAPCGGGAHGFEKFYFELRSRCKEGCVDDKCDYVIKCKEDSLYRHCQGSCGPGFIVGTCGVDDFVNDADCVGFDFDRETFGWDNDQMINQLNAGSPGISLNRVYPCDLITVKSKGVIYSTPAVDELYYSILCNASNANGNFVNHQFFEFVDARFEDGSGNLIYQLNLSDFSILNPTPLSKEYKFSITDPILLASLQAGSGTELVFKATMKVNDNLNATFDPSVFANSFFTMPQIRGQFKARVGSTHHESCDSWGDNMTILNVKTFVNQVDNNIGCPDEPAHGLCERSFKITTEVEGGFTNFMEDFPSEFRPITLWPSNVGTDLITMQLPAGIRLDNTYGGASFNILEWGTNWADVIYSYNSFTQTVTFSGYNPIGGGSPVYNWPALDNHGLQIKMSLSGYFVNDCPPEDPANIDVVLHAPFTDHAYTADTDCRSNQTIETSGINFDYVNSDYDLVMNANVQYPIILTSNQGSFNNLSIRLDYFNPNCCYACGNITIENIWIQVPVIPGNISITSINGFTPDANGFILIPNSALPNNVLVQGNPYPLNINYQINNCTAGVQFPLTIHYGFSCIGNPGDPGYTACIDNQETIQFNTELSGFGFSVTNLTPLSGSPCNSYPFLVTMNSTLNGDVENPTLSVNGDGLILGNPTFCDNDQTPCAPPPLPLFSPYNYAAPNYSWDIDQVVLGNNDGIPGATTNNYQFYLDFAGDCSMANGQADIVFTASGYNICNVQITQNVPYTIVFPPGQTQNCTGCFSCDSLSLNYTQKADCKFSFNAIVPPSAPCTSSTIEWDFGDGATDFGTSVSHQYTLDNTYVVCYKWTCFQDSVPVDSCMVCDTIIVACMADTFCLKIPKDNDADIGEGIMETPDGGFVIAATMHEPGTGGGDADMYFVKYSSAITQEYFNRIGNYGNYLYKENGNSILVRPDGYFIAGTVFLNSNDEDVFVAKVKVDGSLEYGYRYGSDELRKEGAFKIIDMSSNTEQALLVVGYAELKTGNKNVLALKLDPSDLSIIAENTYFYGEQESSQEIGYDAVKTGVHTMTDHFAIVGEQYTNTNDKNIIVLNIASDLSLLSGKLLLSAKRSDIGYGITAASGSLYITGSTSYDSDPNHLLVMKLSAFGLAYESHIIYMQSAFTIEEGRKIIADSDGFLVVVGTNDTKIPTSGPDALILKLRATDDLSKIWSMSTNLQPFNERFHGVTEYHNDSYLATGSYVGASYGDEDVFVARVDKTTGKSCCLNEYPVVGKKSSYTLKDVTEKKPKLIMLPHGEFPPYGGDKYICSSSHSTRYVAEGNIISNRENNTISIYPNPTAGEFIVKFETEFYENCIIHLTDISGRLVKTIEIKPDDESKILIDAKDVSPGIYFIEVDTKSDKWKSKILINR
ncbi:MAG: T9SS type A sorting domain-containing protein [Bacteroidetes bacterium]|nr:T9SS type A sorting domain-containing protein [Bacteroidota bacterium]